MEKRLIAIREHTKQFSIVVDCFANSITPPIMYDSNLEHFGFRYMKPTAKHFCIIKAVRAVSGINAAIVLAENGFNQEVCILIRTIVECTSHIEFILAGLNGNILEEPMQKVVDRYFEDFKRNDCSDFKRPKINQEKVHKGISRNLENSGVTGDTGQFPDISTSELMWNVYATYSNYIHARYPEVMDMYGGNPACYHMKGMSDTPKDDESIKILEVFTNSVAITLALMIQKFDMTDAIKNIPELKGWCDNQ